MLAMPSGKKRPFEMIRVCPSTRQAKRRRFRSEASHHTAASSPKTRSHRISFEKPPPRRAGWVCASAMSGLLHRADVRQVAILLARVQPVPDDEQVGHGEPEILDGDPRAQPRGLLQERAD